MKKKSTINFITYGEKTHHHFEERFVPMGYAAEHNLKPQINNSDNDHLSRVSTVCRYCVRI